MKVPIDIRRVRDFGVGTYTRNLIATLARLDRETAYTLVGAGDDWSHLERLPENFSLLEAEPGRALRLAWGPRRRPARAPPRPARRARPRYGRVPRPRGRRQRPGPPPPLPAPPAGPAAGPPHLE